MSNRLIISFDVGIKHMSYCVLDSRHVCETHTANSSAAQPQSAVQIYDWKILNLIQPNGNVQEEYCNFVQTKTNKKCNHKMLYRKNDKCFCLRHAKMYCNTNNCIMPSKQFTLPHLKKLKREELVSLGNQFHLFDQEVRSTKQSMIQSLGQYFQEHCLELVSNKVVKAKEVSLIDIGKQMNNLLSQLTYLNQVTHVVIENQISPIAGRMKTIQGMLTQFFIMKCPDAHIEYISSINKLKIGQSCEDGETINSYKQHKTSAVTQTLQLLDTQSETLGVSWKEFFVQQKSKRDDLADCFLQGMWYIKQSERR